MVTDCNAVWRCPSSRSKEFTTGHFTLLWRIHLCGLLDWVYSECCSVNPLSSKWNSGGFALHYYYLDFFLECCTQNFWALQQQTGFVDIPLWQALSENSDLEKCLTGGKAGSVLENVWILPGNWWETGMRSVCFLVERELHATKWETAFHCLSLNRFDQRFHDGIKSLHIVI